MANAKKITYKNNTPIAVDYAEKDGNGNVIANTYATISSLNDYVTTANFTWANLSGKPTNISAFTNDAGYITISSLSNYATQDWVKSSGQKYTISLSGSTLTITTNF